MGDELPRSSDLLGRRSRSVFGRPGRVAFTYSEPPAVPSLQLPIPVHANLELGALAVIALGLILKYRWLGLKTLFRHVSTLSKVIHKQLSWSLGPTHNIDW
jgi:hypothetical protein